MPLPATVDTLPEQQFTLSQDNDKTKPQGEQANKKKKTQS